MLKVEAVLHLFGRSVGSCHLWRYENVELEGIDLVLHLLNFELVFQLEETELVKLCR